MSLPPDEHTLHWTPVPPPPPIDAAEAVDAPPPARRSTARRLALALPALTVVASGLAGYLGGRVADHHAATPTAATPVTARTVSSSSSGFDVQAVLDRLQSSVVSVDTTLEQQRGPFVVQGQGAGTGMVLDDQGHILTNAHVVDGATDITVTLSGQSQARKATLVAEDANADVAVLEVSDTTGMVPVALAAKDGAAVGDQVVAIGNALALEGGLSVTEGIVSALDRSIQTDEGSLSGLLQTDAAISSGNSGGPLVNSAGEVVGMNTAVASSSQTVQASNIGFAIPIHDAVDVAHHLIGSAT
jgi:S1-C subfamily serine protease